MTTNIDIHPLLKDSAQKLFHAQFPLSAYRKQRDSHDRVNGIELWRKIIELGWQSLMISESLGGAGLTAAELCLLLEESGRHIGLSPLLSTGLIGVTALNQARQTEHVISALKSIAQGKAAIAFACDEGIQHDPMKVSTTANWHNNHWYLNGHKTFVANVSLANFFLVTAGVAGHHTPALFLIDGSKISSCSQQLLDHSDSGSISFTNLELPNEAMLHPASDNTDLLSIALGSASLGVAAELMGLAKGAFEMTLEYMQNREQFGQYIGSFQALQHRAAKIYIEIELATSALQNAVELFCAADGSCDKAIAAAKYLANEASHLATTEAIQLHGGIGMTDEHNAGLFLKRSRVLQNLYGCSSFHRNKYASLTGF